MTTTSPTTAFDGVDDLRDGGTLSRELPGYTERPAQIEMARTVAQALTDQTHAAIEAGTGTGKSLSYLLPVVRAGKKAVISTANKALQEQLYYKDIPFVQQHIQPFMAAIVKGMGNYLCLDRLEEYRSELFEGSEEALSPLDVAMSEENRWDGDFETLGAVDLPGEVRSATNADHDRCTGKACPFYDDCYYYQMRARAETAQVIVTNHALLLRNVAAGERLLPKHDTVIIDEAHTLEQEATSAFTITVSERAVSSLLALKEVRAHSKDKQLNELYDLTQTVWARLEQVVAGVKGSRVVLASSVEEGLKLASAVGDLAKVLEKSIPLEMTDKGEALHKKTVKRAENLATDLRTVFSHGNTRAFVYYLEVEISGRRGHRRILAHAAPLTVADQLRKSIFGRHDRPVICTSATLSTPRLDYFTHQVGLDQIRGTKERVLPLVFDFAHQALLYLPRRIPEPAYSGEDEEEYLQVISTEMLKLVRASRGRAFLLFSSRRGLDAVYSRIADEIRAEYPVLRQGDLPRSELTRRFRETSGSVLFGLRSFWEGVDIAGEALSLVVIDKLPFTPPDDPIHEARVNVMKAAGENWFGGLALPGTTLLLKQGVGRLIRTSSDRGVMAILDARMHSKNYGKQIIHAMPPARVTTSIRDVESFFGEEVVGAAEVGEPSLYCFCGDEVEYYLPDTSEPSGVRAYCAHHFSCLAGQGGV